MNHPSAQVSALILILAGILLIGCAHGETLPIGTALSNTTDESQPFPATSDIPLQIVSSEGKIPAARVLILSGSATVNVTFLGSHAAFNNTFGLAGPEHYRMGSGHSTHAGSVFSVGPYPAGSELKFFITSPKGTFYTGPAGRNPDHLVHAAVTEQAVKRFVVGFEDMAGGGDTDYDDIFLQVDGEVIIDIPGKNQPPVADAGGPYAGTTGSLHILNASSSFDPDEDLLSYRWDFDGDGTWDTDPLDQSTLLHTYTAPLTGTVRVEVNDGEYTASATSPISIVKPEPEKPWIHLSLSSPTPANGDRVTVTGATNLPEGTEIIMDVASEPNPLVPIPGAPTHNEFAGAAGVVTVKPGSPVNTFSFSFDTDHFITEFGNEYTYLVTAEAVTPEARGDAEFVLMPSPPIAWFLYDVMRGTEPLTVQFYDESARSPATYLWDFGDGTSSTEPNPSHTFGAIARTAVTGSSGRLVDDRGDQWNYTVTLTVSNGAGTDTVRMENAVTVLPKQISPAADTFVDAGFTETLTRDGKKKPVREVNRGDSTGLSVVKGHYGGLDYLYWQGSLIRFDTPPVPAESLEKATLHLYHYTVSPERVSAYRMLKSWEEMEVSFERPAGDASSWASGWYPGGNYAATPTTTVNVAEQDQWHSWDVTDDVKAFLDGSSENHGWFLRAADGGPGSIASAAFSSREAKEGTRPWMEIRVKQSTGNTDISEGIAPLQDGLVQWGQKLHEDLIYSPCVKSSKLQPEIDTATKAGSKPDNWEIIPLDIPEFPIPFIPPMMIPGLFEISQSFNTLHLAYLTTGVTVKTTNEVFHSSDHYWNPTLEPAEGIPLPSPPFPVFSSEIRTLLIGTAPQKCQKYADEARASYHEADPYQAFTSLGYASHFMGDLGFPMHTGFIPEQAIQYLQLGGDMTRHHHGIYEAYVSENWMRKGFVIHIQNDQYWYSVLNPFKTTRNIARFSHGYLDRAWSIPWSDGVLSPEDDKTIQAISDRCLIVTERNIVGLVKYIEE